MVFTMTSFLGHAWAGIGMLKVALFGSYPEGKRAPLVKLKIGGKL